MFSNNKSNKNYQKNILEYDSSNYFIKVGFDDIVLNILYLNSQETKFGTRLHIFSSIADAPGLNQFIHISAPAHLAN